MRSSAVYEDVFIPFVEEIQEIDGDIHWVEIDEFWSAVDADFSCDDTFMDGCIEVGSDVKDGFDISGFEQFQVKGIVMSTEP